MFSMTGMALSSYMLRIVRDIVIRNPRFQRALGDVSITSATQISFGNLQVLIRDINTEGTRLSFDYFMSTLVGRAILTQVGDKDGSFIEWVTETDVSAATPVAGVYYFNVDSVDEQTRNVNLTIESYKWYQGQVNNAQGTLIAFRQGIDGTTVTAYDTAAPTVPLVVQASQTGIYLLNKVSGLIVKNAAGVALTPNTDYWAQAEKSIVILSPTIFGTQTATIPPGYLTVSLVDQNGYVLRPNLDYIYLSATEVQLSAWTGAGDTISVTGQVALDPTIPANLLNAENTLALTLLPGETLVPDQVFISTQDADHIQVIANADGTVTLPTPVPPGGWYTYEVRVLVGSSQVVCTKNAVNSGVIPGLRIAIGDRVVANDQCAIIVSPTLTETYHVYGSKPGISFSLDVKANDPTTADEISKTLLEELFIHRKNSIESDGLTLYEASSSFASAVRDDSGTAPAYTNSLSFTAAADWRVFVPLVTRITNFAVTTQTYAGPIRPTSRYSCLNVQGFLPGYR